MPSGQLTSTTDADAGDRDEPTTLDNTTTAATNSERRRIRIPVPCEVMGSSSVTFAARALNRLNGLWRDTVRGWRARKMRKPHFRRAFVARGFARALADRARRGADTGYPRAGTTRSRAGGGSGRRWNRKRVTGVRVVTRARQAGERRAPGARAPGDDRVAESDATRR
ncbi:hypothetical protein GCM10009660_15550 [Catellatospora bangladeshensis]